MEIIIDRLKDEVKLHLIVQMGAATASCHEQFSVTSDASALLAQQLRLQDRQQGN